MSFLRRLPKKKKKKKKRWENDFWPKVADGSAYTLGVKKIWLYLIPFYAFFAFTQKFKMAAQNSGKTIFEKKGR